VPILWISWKPEPFGALGSYLGVQGIALLLLLLLLLTAIGFSPGGSSPTLVQTKIKIHKTIITTKHQKTQNNKITAKQ
jgi:hypothetical protein